MMLNISAISYAVMYLTLECGYVGIVLISYDYMDRVPLI